MDTDTAAATPERLRRQLVDQLRGRGVVRTVLVEDALRAVPRHLFVPDTSLENAYAPDTAVVTKRDTMGKAISSASAPAIVAMMLEQLDAQPGHRVLEIGAGTGYNAALLAHIVGPSGAVTTIDLDQDIVDAARHGLTATGYEHVRTICGDGELGYPGDAPYDRIIVTVGAGDLPPAWLDQLTADGRIVVPLRLRGLMRSVAFEWEAGHLTSRSVLMAGFVPMRGIGGYADHVIELGDTGVSLRTEGPADAESLQHALSQPRSAAWTEVRFSAGESLEHLDLWMARMQGYCQLIAQPPAIEHRLVAPTFQWGGSAVVADSTLAYLTLRSSDPSEGAASTHGFQGTGWEVGVYAHGPGALQLADNVAEQIRVWDRDHRALTDPKIEVRPGPPARASDRGKPIDTGDRSAGQFAIARRHHRIVVTWPAAPGVPSPAF